MFSPAPRAGRRRAQTVRRLPDLTAVTSLSRPTVVKALVGLGLATSVAAAVAIPVQAEPDQAALSSQTSALIARDRAEAVSGTTSRSSGRSAVSSTRTSLSAPAAAESAAVSAGTAGVTAVAKPKPAPVPKAKPKPTVAPAKPVEKKVVKKVERKAAATPTRSTRSTSSTRTSTSSSSGSGASMAFYDAGRAKGLGDNAAKVYSAIRSSFGITTIGGYRAGAGDHGTGKAVDVMVTGSRGDAVAQWAINNMGAYDITYVIWKQRIWLAGASGWRAMEDRGSVTANHYDHVHISVE